MTPQTSNRIQQEKRLRWLPLAEMKVSPLAQRDLRPPHVDKIAANFDAEKLGTITVNIRDGSSYVIDGMHRVEALRQIGWGDQNIQCWVYEGLTEQQEAEYFLTLNATLTVDTYAKFKVGITAGREIECDIDRIVKAQGLVVSRDAIPGAIRAVGTLRRVYTRSSPATLSRTLKLIKNAYGDPGMDAGVIDGISLLCQRYNGQLEDGHAIAQLGKAHGGVNGLLGRAENIRRSTGNAKGHCVAAAAVEIIRTGKNGKRLPSWWAS